ncbi:twinfilin-1 [Clohesyomyces aquaticus]|uniref:Twinfilin n=1 Tax=Clohesyomyces aquaticus TaxID=1231657 RepID=A0A1Y1ZJM1_9PLEO|nr:twinfilin-1 [Clohesyomyces aquaticus]
MQSGISASPALLTALQTLLSTPTQRGLLATISSEQIHPGASIPSTPPSTFLSDLSNLSSHLTPTTALYILLKRAPSLPSSDQSLIAITYIPATAPVRQKMLFASTRLTLVRELGSERFGESVFVTEADELTAAGWERHEAHSEAEKPLTKEEKELEGIREQEALEGGGMQGKGLASIKGGQLETRAGEGIAEALASLATDNGEGNLVQLRMDPTTETLQLASVTTSTPSSLSTTIPSSEPRFSFYRFTEGGNDAVVFISTCPSGAKIKERMLYAASRGNVIALAQQQGLSVAKRIEATNPEEVTEGVIREEFKTEQVEEKKGFAKPKRPGRR